MYLKEIQTYGFKSFADKINFEFTKNINGIVGPNGSGKSNVVDAVRWVLGEASNKQLRASDTTSVIFSGSKSRKPLNSAMVNIIFDNSDRHLPINFNEVSIKRVLYRTGENEYYLNGAKCRLKDITELLTDSGAAKESFNIIGQGKIDEILSTKPYDRRVIFEEAAGVLKYKKRKEEAIRKLERTNNNINRVNDIINEIETNLEPLKKQSDEANKYLEIKDKLTNFDISLMVYDLDRYSKEFEDNKLKLTKLNDNITELNMNNTTYDVSILQGRDKLNKLNTDINNINNKILEYTKELEQTDADIRLLRERKKYIKSDDNLDKINNIKEQILIKNNLLGNLNNEIALLNEKIKVSEDDIVNNNSKYNDINNNINKYNKKIDDNNREITNLNYKISYLEETINNGGSIPSSVKNLLHNPLFSGVHNTIGSLLEVPDEYALAVSTSLGGASNYLVVDDRKLASRMVEYLRDNRLGRATLFPLDVIKGRYIDNEIINKLEVTEGYINILANVVKYDNKYENIIMNQLGNVILANNIKNANNISQIINNRYKVVTLDGQVVNVGGSITGGEKIKTNDLIKQKYELNDYRNKLTKLLNDNNDMLSTIEEEKKKIKTYEEKIYNGKLDVNTMNEEIKNKNINKDSLETEVNSLVKELKDIESISNNNEESEENNLVNKYYKIKENIDTLNKEIASLNIERERIDKDIKEVEEISRNSNLNVSKVEKELHDIELKNSKLEIKIDTILNSLNEDYGITYSEAKNKYILEDNAEEVRKEVINLKNTIKDCDMVNLGAPAEYERVNTRYEFLTKQREDLNKAEDTLLEIIHDMDNIMKDKFVTTFNEIKVEFKKVFKELFKGGDADIYMTNPEDILETGIELEATPPGKNLKNIQSLSGGERTFTAISLLFAILNVRPVPFCIFDEVEAALDEANVDAFGEYLDKYRDKTQFIIITHKKRTMEYVDTLYGITMQESGVSKRVSVKLGDIKK
jgi:chromosome segregation protein